MKKVSVLAGVLSLVFYIAGCGSQTDNATTTDSSTTGADPAGSAQPAVNAVAQQAATGENGSTGGHDAEGGSNDSSEGESGTAGGYGAEGESKNSSETEERMIAGNRETTGDQEYTQNSYPDGEGEGGFGGQPAQLPKLEEVDTPQQAVFEFNRILMSRISERIAARRGPKTSARGEGDYPADYSPGRAVPTYNPSRTTPGAPAGSSSSTFTTPASSGSSGDSSTARAFRAGRTAARRTQAKNNLKQIVLAMHNYHDVHRHFPPAAGYGPGNQDRGKPGAVPHSWRVELLPFLDASDLYEQYKFNEPWDSNNNKKVLAKMPSVFRDPNDDSKSMNSSYFALVGKGTAFSSKDGISIRNITDGSSNTIAVVEAKRKIPWTKPEDIPFDPKKDVPKLGGWYDGGYNVSLCDGSVRFVPDSIETTMLKRLIQMNDGQAVKWPQSPSKTTRK